jgi:hypothetical protein
LRSGHDVEEGRSLANEFEGAGWFGIEVSVKVLIEDMDEVDDSISYGFSHIAILH